MKSLYTVFPIESQNVNYFYFLSIFFGGGHLLFKLKHQIHRLLPDLKENKLEGRNRRMKD